MKELLKEKLQFDPPSLKTMIEEFSVYPIGSWVELNTNELAKVVRVNKEHPLRPTVSVMFNANKRKLEQVKIIELAKHPTLHIKKPLDNGELEPKTENATD